MRRVRAEDVARRYIGSDQPLEALGAGAEGFVFVSPQHNAVEAHDAIKVFTHAERFEQELAVYHRLRQHGVSRVMGFAVPKLVGFDRELLVIEMTIVQPPYLLDFAQSVLDAPPDFPEGLDEWWERIRPDFGDRLPIVQELFYTLVSKYGIHYYDLAPRNINFGDTTPALPGTE